MTNYTRGRALEYRVKAHLEAKGYYVFRTAGSHSLFDLLAFRSDVVRLIQVKSKKHRISKGEMVKMQEWMKKYPSNPFIFGHFVLPVKRGTKTVFQFFNENGAKINV
jgi:Holliday junction resolvase